MNDIGNAIKILKQGGIVIFPTDTAFGIGCRADSASAVERLFLLRKRPSSQAVPVLVDSVEMAQKYYSPTLPNVVRRLIEKYWPGGLTAVYTWREHILPSLVVGGGSTIGLRMPDHEIALDLIRGVGVPVLGPSANFHGEVTPYHFEDVSSDLMKKVDAVVPGECKRLGVSTVVDCTQKPWRIIRQGAVVLDTIDWPLD
jgi:L-threonylcarbamoyladenylate synthase